MSLLITMILAACATEFEMQYLPDQPSSEAHNWIPLVTGVGVVETTLHVTRFLEQHQGEVDRVVHFGVGGAYLSAGVEKMTLLDICLAEQEFFGDFGICYPDRIEPLSDELLHKKSYRLDGVMLRTAKEILSAYKYSYYAGTFVTVSGVSATAARGNMLGKQYGALCENMEGAAMARVCEAFRLPLLELRTISNFVEDRDVKNWKLVQACEKAGDVAAQLINGLISKSR